MTRRELLIASAAAGAAGCASGARTKKPADVAVLRAPAYDQSLYETVRRIVAMQRVPIRGRRVLLKPNMVEFVPGAPIHTNALFVHAAYEAFRAAGAADVLIAEGPGHRRPTLDLFDAAGYFALMPRFDELFTDLNVDDVAKRPVGRVSQLESLYLPKIALGADLLVSLPKMKTHHWAGVTLASKNLFGTVPGSVYGWPKNILHWAGINECIADLRSVFPQAIALVDGIECMEGDGPIQGSSRNVGVVVAGTDLTAVDATCCRMMGIEPERVKHLELTAGVGQLDTALIRQIGEKPEAFRKDFEMAPGFSHLRA